MNHDQQVREAALDAAEEALDSTGKVRLDTVAEAAGVTVVELREHFARAPALLAGLLERWLRRFDDRVAAQVTLQEQTAGHATRALVAAALSDDDGLRPPWRRASVAAAALHQEDVVRVLARWVRGWERELAADEVHPDRLTLVLLGLRALAADELTGAAPALVGQDERRAVRRALTALLARPGAKLGTG